MKTGQYNSIPMAMLLRKHYCRKCGTKLCRNPNIRVVSRKDLKRKNFRLNISGDILPIGDIEVTEYNFICPGCETVTEFDEQVVIRKIQKKLQNNILSDAELEGNREWAADLVERNRKICNAVFQIISIAVTAMILFSILCGAKFKIRF